MKRMKIEFRGLKNSRLQDIDPVEENVGGSFEGVWAGMQDYKDAHRGLTFCAVDKYGLGIGRLGFHDEDGRIIPGGMFRVFPEFPEMCEEVA